MSILTGVPIAESATSDTQTSACPSPWPSLIPVLHCVTVFTSAFLLFSVQPLMGRLILPWFGGSASVWSACMLFFQVFLLAGYAYADLSSRQLGPRAQGGVHAALLAASLCLLPIRLNPSIGLGQTPAVRIALILAAGVGIPYLLLSATSPLVQLWYARACARNPYRLYALSNLGSLLALISYPTVVEPYVTVRKQLPAWSTGFGVFAGMCGIAALFAAHYIGFDATAGRQPAVTPRASVQLLWVALAAGPSALLLATTNHLCQNVAAIPFLWIIPLAAYLVTLILCFDYDSPRRHRVFIGLTPLALTAMSYASLHGSFSMNPRLLIPLFTAGMFIVCMTFHGELVMRKPASSDSTSFYLMVSLGGAMGGVLIVLVAPRVLSGVFDLPISLVAASMFLLFIYYRRHWYLDAIWVAASIATLVFAMQQIRAFSAGTRVAMRSFYGALRVVDGPTSRMMVHGTVLHGTQFQDPGRRKQATTYYAPSTGVGLVLERFRRGPQSVGIVGLGAGTLAAYAQLGDHYVFYELNPQVIHLARHEFSYIDHPGVEIVEGDGRLTLARDPRVFDVLVLDAFSGDSIPTHLLTEEAMRVYLRHLSPDGILCIHISNSVLDLESPVAKLAKAAGVSALLVHTPPDAQMDQSEAIWAIMSPAPDRLRNPQLDKIARLLRVRPGQRLWTDDYSNLFQLLKSR